MVLNEKIPILSRGQRTFTAILKAVVGPETRHAYDFSFNQKINRRRGERVPKCSPNNKDVRADFFASPLGWEATAVSSPHDANGEPQSALPRSMCESEESHPLLQSDSPRARPSLGQIFGVCPRPLGPSFQSTPVRWHPTARPLPEARLGDQFSRRSLLPPHRDSSVLVLPSR